MSDAAWTHKRGIREMEIAGEVAHLSLKIDLIEHIWETWGL